MCPISVMGNPIMEETYQKERLKLEEIIFYCRPSKAIN
jgi:hypothetical protein